jgi:hypothetical protein
MYCVLRTTFDATNLPAASVSRGSDSGHVQSPSPRYKVWESHTLFFEIAACDRTCECLGFVGAPQDTRPPPNRKMPPGLENKRFGATTHPKCDWGVNFRGMWGNVGMRWSLFWRDFASRPGDAHCGPLTPRPGAPLPSPCTPAGQCAAPHARRWRNTPLAAATVRALRPHPSSSNRVSNAIG